MKNTCVENTLWPLDHFCSAVSECNQVTRTCDCFDQENFVEYGDLSSLGGCYIHRVVLQTLWGISAAVCFICVICTAMQTKRNFWHDLVHRKKSLCSKRPMAYATIPCAMMAIVGTVISIIRVIHPELRYGIDEVYTWLHSFTLWMFWSGCHYYLYVYVRMVYNGPSMTSMRNEWRKNDVQFPVHQLEKEGYHKRLLMFIIFFIETWMTLGTAMPIIAVYQPNDFDNLSLAHLLMLAFVLIFNCCIFFPVCIRYFILDIDMFLRLVGGGEPATSGSNPSTGAIQAQEKLRVLRVSLIKDRNFIFLNGISNGISALLTATIPVLRAAAIPYYMPLSIISMPLATLFLLPTMTTGASMKDLKTSASNGGKDPVMLLSPQAASVFDSERINITESRLHTIVEAKTVLERGGDVSAFSKLGED